MDPAFIAERHTSNAHIFPLSQRSFEGGLHGSYGLGNVVGLRGTLLLHSFCISIAPDALATNGHRAGARRRASSVLSTRSAFRRYAPAPGPPRLRDGAPSGSQYGLLRCGIGYACPPTDSPFACKGIVATTGGAAVDFASTFVFVDLRPKSIRQCTLRRAVGVSDDPVKLDSDYSEAVVARVTIFCYPFDSSETCYPDFLWSTTASAVVVLYVRPSQIIPLQSADGHSRVSQSACNFALLCPNAFDFAHHQKHHPLQHNEPACQFNNHTLPTHTTRIMSAFVVPSIESATNTSPRRGSLRERCGFTLWLSFAPALPNIRAKGHLEPTVGNLPRRKRSSVVSLDLPDPVRVVDANSGRVEYFA
ncbi:hypothetical protein C8R46DRAFT_1358194 [Mycena filopes]|nr:hypothetical protein C8R46DRAFT_1358194 [Mycena filopes]